MKTNNHLIQEYLLKHYPFKLKELVKGVYFHFLKPIYFLGLSDEDIMFWDSVKNENIRPNK